MTCRISSLAAAAATLFKPSREANPPRPSFPLPTTRPRLKRHAIVAPCSSGAGPPEAAAATPGPAAFRISFTTLKDCKLGISRFPDFEYDAEGGEGTAAGTTGPSGDVVANFDVGTLSIPSLTSATTRFLGFPLPPFLRIDIVPELLNGVINKETGKVELDFRAKFWFSAGSFHRAPPLLVETKLTSEEASGKLRGGRGERMDEEGKCRLVGVAAVDPVGDIFTDLFLGLPTECLAVLNAKISLSDPNVM